jgi:predicted aspartyl protease
MQHPVSLGLTWLRSPAVSAAIAAALLPLFAPLALAACTLEQLAELTTSASSPPVVPVTINGQAASIVVGTGAVNSIIWRSAAQALHLTIAPYHRSIAPVAGGADTLGRVWVKDLAVGGFVLHDFVMLADGRPGSEQNVGILGENFLSNFDIEFDLGKNVIRLFRAEGCKSGQAVYWANSYSVVDLARAAGAIADGTNLLSSRRHFIDPGRVIAHVSLNGQDALAMFDTGAPQSVVSSAFVRSRNIPSESVPIEAAPGPGLAGKAVPTEVATFSVLSIGQENLQNVRLQVADLWGGTRQVDTGSMVAHDAVAPADMLIGSDFFRAHRVFMSNSQGKLYFTYQGGPVFVPTPVPASAAGSAPAHAP